MFFRHVSQLIWDVCNITAKEKQSIQNKLWKLYDFGGQHSLICLAVTGVSLAIYLFVLNTRRVDWPRRRRGRDHGRLCYSEQIYEDGGFMVHYFLHLVPHWGVYSQWSRYVSDNQEKVNWNNILISLYLYFDFEEI